MSPDVPLFWPMYDALMTDDDGMIKIVQTDDPVHSTELIKSNSFYFNSSFKWKYVLRFLAHKLLSTEHQATLACQSIFERRTMWRSASPPATRSDRRRCTRWQRSEFTSWRIRRLVPCIRQMAPSGQPAPSGPHCLVSPGVSKSTKSYIVKKKTESIDIHEFRFGMNSIVM